LLFHLDNGIAKAPQCYVIRTAYCLQFCVSFLCVSTW